MLYEVITSISACAIDCFHARPGTTCGCPYEYELRRCPAHDCAFGRQSHTGLGRGGIVARPGWKRKWSAQYLCIGVITSYSIHYTKLYELTFRATICTSRKRQRSTKRSNVYVWPRPLRCSLARMSLLWLRFRASTVWAARKNLAGGRITSYNVCYTKLLRGTERKKQKRSSSGTTAVKPHRMGSW